MKVISVGKQRVRGGIHTKKGYFVVKGKKTHDTLYFFDDEGKFHTRRLNLLEIPIYKLRIVKRFVYFCEGCNCKFRSMSQICQFCNSKMLRTKLQG